MIKSFNSKNFQKEKKFTNIINSEIIGLIDQNSSKITEIKDEILKPQEEKTIQKERMKDFNFEEIEKTLGDLEKNEKKPEDSISSKEDIIKKEEVIKEKTQEQKPKIQEKKPKPKKEPIKKIDQKNKKKPANNKNKTLKNEEKAIQDFQNQLKKAEKALKSQQINTSGNFGEQSMASLGAFIKTKIIECWSIPPSIGIINDQKIYVVVQIKLDKNGEILNSKIINDSQFFHNEYFEKIKQSALEATTKCSPILGLPNERFEDWKEVELIFDPSKL